MIPKFKRPSNIPYPNVWYRFQLKNPHSEELVNFRIEDITPNRYEDAVKHLVAHFLPDETICESRNVSSDLQSIAEFQDIVRVAIMEHKLTIGCYREGSDELIAVNVLYVKQRDEMADWSHYNSRRVRDIVTTHMYVCGQFNVFRHYKTRRCLSGFALSVLPQYREIGIGQKMLEANKYIARMLGLNLISLLLTSNVAQRCAERAGYDKNYEITFAKLACKGGTFTYYPLDSSARVSVHSLSLLK